MRTREARPANGDDPLPVDVGRDLDVDDRSGSPGADAARGRGVKSVKDCATASDLLIELSGKPLREGDRLLVIRP
jgi:hypothetical protein